MKKREDFVSNSSSSSFVIDMPSALELDDDFVRILVSANYVHFINVAYWNMRKAKGYKTVKAYDKFKDEVKKAFGTKASVDYENRDCDEVPPEKVYVEFDTDNFYRNYTAKKRNLLERLIANSDTVYLDFGDDYEGGAERATQAATLLDYIYGATIISDDSEHFDYTPVEDLGIARSRK